MTAETKDKITELVELDFFNGKDLKNIDHYDDLPQDKKEYIFNLFMQGLLWVYSKVSLSNFVSASGLAFDTVNLDVNFNASIRNHTLNIKGIFAYLIYSVLYNWSELFEKMVFELNSYVIPRCYNDWGHKISSIHFTVEEIKEFVKFCIEEIGRCTDFIDRYNDYVKPYQNK